MFCSSITEHFVSVTFLTDLCCCFAQSPHSTLPCTSIFVREMNKNSWIPDYFVKSFVLWWFQVPETLKMSLSSHWNFIYHSFTVAYGSETHTGWLGLSAYGKKISNMQEGVAESHFFLMQWHTHTARSVSLSLSLTHTHTLQWWPVCPSQRCRAAMLAAQVQSR